MQAHAFWKAVTVDRSDLLGQLLELLRDEGVRFCAIGGLAVNAYVEPVVTLDLDLAVAVADMPRLEPALAARFDVHRFPHSLNISLAGSDLRVQIQTDQRYAIFVDRAQPRDVLGIVLPVADVKDLLQGKVWAAQDPARRASKRQKDLADIARLLEAFPDLRPSVPQDILVRLV
jgi:hypothetical protein